MNKEIPAKASPAPSGAATGGAAAAAAPPTAIDALNRSGYPLQIALARAVQAESKSHGWRVIYEEHSWKSRAGKGSGYIDLVLENQAIDVVLVIECKRIQNKEWSFLSETGAVAQRRFVRGLLSLHEDRRRLPNYPNWADQPMDPPTPAAAFCVMPKDAREPSVDTIASELVVSTECLASEESDLYVAARGGKSRRLYLAAIVTTADLIVCDMDAAQISLADGLVPAGATTTPVNAIRYTKQLASEAPVMIGQPAFGAEAGAIAHAKTRTVFIIRADYLNKFLKNLTIDSRAD